MLQTVSLVFVLPMLSGAVLAALWRLMKGPSLADRVVAFDLMATAGVGICAVYSIATVQPVFLDVALVIALISFLGTVAFAYYMEKKT
jgi:multicomponent Na+:H+ antiporter subunit F